MIPKVAGWKKERVSELTEVFNSEGVVAIVDVSGVPASNMIDMRNTLRDRMTITMATLQEPFLLMENFLENKELYMKLPS